MSKIKILPDHIANMIAAGEVVERPASVVKELLENAIDAEAKTIRVELLDGGKHLIMVQDDGLGMGKDDLFISVEPHATSKIANEIDLESIMTLGFRGEALPSIAAVSRFSITSRPKEQLEGYKLGVHFGKDKMMVPTGCPPGTSVEVEDLFLFLPARLRFLKGRQTEIGHVSQAVRLLSAGHPDIRFELVSEGKTIFRSREGLKGRDRLWPLLGDEITEKLKPVTGSVPGIDLEGYITPPEAAITSSRLFYFFLNSRPISNRLLWKALNEAAKGVFMKGAYPAGAIFLTVSPDIVDINVHPTKQEVRFFNTDIVFRLLYGSLKKALEEHEKYPSSEKEIDYRPSEKAEDLKVADNARHGWEKVMDELYSAPPEQHAYEAHECRDQGASFSRHGVKVMGQLGKSYIVAENEKGLLIIDQHAAHEAVLFSRLKKRFMEGRSLFSQPLMFPKTLELSASAVSRLHEIQPILRRIGFVVEIFGPAQVIIKAKPDLIDEAAACEILDKLLNTPSNDESSLLHDISARIACKSAIKAHHSLEMPEMTELINEIYQEKAFRCPHGRPVIQEIGLEELEKDFGRR